MPYKYSLLNNSEKALEVYPSPSSAGKPYADKLSVGTIAYGNEMQGVWLKTTVKNNTGWIDTRDGDLTINDDAPDVPIPDGEKLGWLVGDWELFGKSRIELREEERGHQMFTKDGRLLGGYPLTLKLLNTKSVPFYEDKKGKTFSDFGRLAYETMAAGASTSMSPDSKLKAFKSVMDEDTAFTDFRDGKEQNPVICANNIVYVRGGAQKVSGKMRVPIRVLKIGNYNAMKAQLLKYPRLAFDALISLRRDGGRGVDPFGQLGGRAVKVLMFGYTDTDWVDAERVRLLDTDEPIPNSYWPPRV